jgi:uncharacterized Zn-binding protein involved in type VI secretion
MPPNATMTASLMCSFGLGAGSLIVTQPTVLIEGKPAANILDMAPLSNVPPMGMCTSLANPTVAAATSAALGVLTPMPCVPVIPGPWLPQAPKTMIRGAPALVAGSQCMCAYGGAITMSFPGATKTLSS